MIYFAQAGSGKTPIKIGYTEDPDLRNRLSGLQTGNPYPLRVLGVIAGGTLAHEAAIHRKFAASALMGEWFSYTAELRQFIRYCASGYAWGSEAPKPVTRFLKGPKIKLQLASLGEPF